MSLVDELARFETLLGARFPELFDRLEPGLDDAGIDRMRASVAPLRITPELESLYRWRDGGPVAVFAGWRMLPFDEVLGNRPVQLGLLGEPPAWLRLFGDRIIAFVTLGVGDETPDSSLWYGHTHDVPLDRIADSLEAFVASCADALDDGSLTLQRDSLLLEGGRDASSHEFTPFRLAHSPAASTYRNETAPNRLMRTPDLDWPEPWLSSFSDET